MATKQTPKRRAQPVHKKPKASPKRPAPSTALAVRPQAPVAVINPEVPMELQIQKAIADGSLTEMIQLGQFGLVEAKFTEAEELVLSEAPLTTDVRLLPTGQVYLPHIHYTKWLNRAFGRTGWALRPAALPGVKEKTVVVPYLLYVHGKPVAFALGEQEYFGKGQSYGDCLESTVASGLRRCCKHIGMALELWDRDYATAFLETFGVRVTVKVYVWEDGKKKSDERKQWRRKSDPPFPTEVRRWARTMGDDEDEREPAPEMPTVAADPNANNPITPDQVKRFWTIARGRGRQDSEVEIYLSTKGYKSSRDIKRKDYETLVTAIQHPGPLQTGRDPGQEG